MEQGAPSRVHGIAVDSASQKTLGLIDGLTDILRYIELETAGQDGGAGGQRHTPVVAEGDERDTPQNPAVEIGYVDPVIRVGLAIEVCLATGAVCCCRRHQMNVPP